MALPAVLAGVGRAAAAGGRAGGMKNLVSLGNDIGQLGFAAQTTGGLVKELAKGLVPLAPHIGLIVGGLNLFKDAIGSIGAGVGEFVKLASPVHFQKFQMAMEDFTAVIGKILVPVMEYGTALVRFFADVLWRLSDPLQRVTTALMKPLIVILDTMLDKGAPLIEFLVLMIEVTAELYNTLANVIIEIVKFIAELDILKTFFGALGLKEGKKLKDGSVGAAVRPATISSVEEYGKKAQQAAFSLGSAGPKAEERTASATEELVKLLKNVPAAIGEMLLKAIPTREQIQQQLLQHAMAVAEALARVLPGGKGVKERVDDGREAAKLVEARVRDAERRARDIVRETFGIDLP